MFDIHTLTQKNYIAPGLVSTSYRDNSRILPKLSSSSRWFFADSSENKEYKSIWHLDATATEPILNPPLLFPGVLNHQ